jgi:very-short-patch-repair endonuclease
MIDYLIYTVFYFPTGVVDSRNKSTSAEAELWNILKSKKLNARKFRRQHSIGNYIVDFFCASEKLVIELDGNPHGEYHNQPPRPESAFVS